MALRNPIALTVTYSFAAFGRQAPGLLRFKAGLSRIKILAAAGTAGDPLKFRRKPAFPQNEALLACL